MSIKDKIFKGNNPNYTAHYGWQESCGDKSYTFGYINSYKEAGDTLVEEKIPDLLLFPIMFSYRQYLELLLKNICEKRMDTEEYRNLIKKASHNLTIIWDVVKVKIQYEVSSDDINLIAEVVEIFSSIDPYSFTFRYEKDKKQNSRSINEDYLTINTLNLKEIIDKVDDILRYTYDSN